ncbi:metal-sensing transcriptional repressor [Massilia sp. CCM 8733]|uniref:Metal-sensing transcriptional repressor n=1 Tax=Massilia mucilaginosa TaxID=2609282 RepID=A0ABX0P0X4_9BURK|nr:metal-sensing transcriptional repressor [Massilia mucilaginosa]NHZ92933.1 metal-sensing transcriptional repressor [Massilia mucilaginosa]
MSEMVESSALSALQKKELLHRLARIEGQLRGVQKLVALAATPADFDAVAQQMAAARKALDRSFVQLLTNTMQTQSANATSLAEAQASASKLAAMLDKFA